MTTRILMSSGVLFDLANPRVADVRRADILLGLGRLNRFTGQCPTTVLEHSVRVAHRVLEQHGDPTLTLVALYHDAHEAYSGDISTPMKHLLGYARVAEIEESLQYMVHRALYVPAISPQKYLDTVKVADLEVLSWEYDRFFDSNHAPVKTPEGIWEDIVHDARMTWDILEASCREDLRLPSIASLT